MKEPNIAFSTQFKMIQYDFSAEKISSDGGVLILNQIEVNTKYLAHIAMASKGLRRNSLSTYTETQCG